MAISFNEAREIKNEAGVENGSTASYYIVKEFHHYPLDFTSSGMLFGYKDLAHFNSFGVHSYCERVSMSFNKTGEVNEPKSVSEFELKVIEQTGWTGGSIV